MFLPNIIKRITQRKFIINLLMLLPENFFPSFRIIVNNDVIQKNRSIRRRRIYETESSTFSESESTTSCDSIRPKYCCKCCRKLDKDEGSSTSEGENEDALADIPLPPPLPPTLLEGTMTFPEGINMFENMSSVKLRPVSLDTRSLPERHSSPKELLHILKKRYSAMHSPSPRKKYKKFDPYESDEIDEHNMSFCLKVE
ncbi:hypothetical protein WA026_012142 [Henosepilachna vigintioctopunctata]|uniref:Uncharacterized protein n=1 Tax=Henosepilachna vigintioctopunctata TaxID=420089 RepID=A0AAW1V6Q0_9CUCU